MIKFAGARPTYCEFCNKQVYFHKEKRKTVVYNLDFSNHICEQLKIQPVKTLTRNDIDPEILKQYEDNMNK